MELSYGVIKLPPRRCSGFYGIDTPRLVPRGTRFYQRLVTADVRSRARNPRCVLSGRRSRSGASATNDAVRINIAEYKFHSAVVNGRQIGRAVHRRKASSREISNGVVHRNLAGIVSSRHFGMSSPWYVCRYGPYFNI